MIKKIAITKLHPHPQNPRKLLGDLTELAESIKVRGVLQNLTIVPIDAANADTDYTVIIGHRRLAAGQLAGLTEMPCVIEDMDQKTQIATMLLENIQRSDLTVYEQAQGFQLMLDFGETVGDISKQTGFSNTTVRKRVKLLELDNEKFAKSVERGATIADYDALSKIKDIKLRNKVLDKIGTANFDWELKSALSSETSAENKAAIIEVLETFATKIKDSETSKYQHVRYISLDNPNFEIPDDAGDEKYFYTESTYSMYLYKERQVQEKGQEKPQKSPEELEREKRLDDLKALFKQAYELRLAFAKGFRGTGKTADAVDKKAIEIIFSSYARPNHVVFRELFGIKEKLRMSWESKEKGETYDEVLPRVIADNANTQNTTLLFWGAYCNLESPDENCLRWGGNVFSLNEKLQALYDYLVNLGYEMSDVEKALMDGSHELYNENAPYDDEDNEDEEDDVDDEDENE